MYKNEIYICRILEKQICFAFLSIHGNNFYWVDMHKNPDLLI